METQEKVESLTLRRPERRSHPRYRVDESASLLLVRHGYSVPCRVVELSLRGCRMRTRERFIAGILIRVEVLFTIGEVTIRLSGVTQWTDEKRGVCTLPGRGHVGIRFLALSDRKRSQVERVINEIRDWG
jgi:hypothetical protein